MLRFFLLATILTISFSAQSIGREHLPSVRTVPKQPEELGAVKWFRDFDQALKESKKTGKPVLILFQEVPGCSNCTTYGNNILSQPLLVEAIEDLFVPLAVFNNKGGKDAAVLKRYNEPSWNNPVVRIVNVQGENLIDRLSNFRSAAQLSSGMLSALRRSERAVPKYLQLLNEEHILIEQKTAVATFQTACFWTGEAYLGKQSGVVQTESGWQNGREVVRVEYSIGTTSEEVLAEAAIRREYKKANEGKFRPDRETKYYLLKSKYSKAKMSELQAIRVNTMLAEGRNPKELLSPRQRLVIGGK